MINANANLVNLYYRIGKTIFENSSWGNKFIDYLSMELKIAFPRQKGFSIRNLKYMKSFYMEYKDDNEFVQLVAQIPWKHNIILMQKIKDKNVRKWYIEKIIEEGWVESVLLYQLDTNLYQRQIKNIKHTNFDLTLKQNSDLANYIVDQGLHEKNNFNYLYNNEKSIKEKIEILASNVYHAGSLEYSSDALNVLEEIDKLQLNSYPICVAKTQYSISDNKDLLGYPKDYTLHVKSIRIQTGSKMIIVLLNDIITMPGLPKIPNFESMQ